MVYIAYCSKAHKLRGRLFIAFILQLLDSLCLDVMNMSVIVTVVIVVDYLMIAQVGLVDGMVFVIDDIIVIDEIVVIVIVIHMVVVNAVERRVLWLVTVVVALLVVS